VKGKERAMMVAWLFYLRTRAAGLIC
jgi:hypothetical protein